jgi:carbonic anhydrase/acetyltransferase-like protein (isoleucine patch superfamily)
VVTYITVPSSLVSLYALGEKTPTIDPTAFVHPDCTIIGDVTIGPESSVWPQAVLRGDASRIVIGARTSIQDGAVIHCTHDAETRIGDDCVIGHLVHMEGCVIEDCCLVGSGSIVLHRAIVRSGALVGAAAVVTNNTEVPSRAMALGVPAVIKPDRSDPELVKLQAAGYVMNTKLYRDKLRPLT